MSKVRLYGATSGYVELAAPDVSDDGVLTLPTSAEGFVVPSQLAAGIGPNVVSTLFNTAFSTTSTSFTAVSGLNTTITPSSATSKILLILQLSMANSNDNSQKVLYRLTGGNALDYTTGRNSIATADYFGNKRNGSDPYVGVYLDSPATASAITYGVEVRTTGGTLRVNSDGFGTINTTVSTLTAIEVAA